MQSLALPVLRCSDAVLLHFVLQVRKPWRFAALHGFHRSVTDRSVTELPGMVKTFCIGLTLSQVKLGYTLPHVILRIGRITPQDPDENES